MIYIFKAFKSVTLITVDNGQTEFVISIIIINKKKYIYAYLYLYIPLYHLTRIVLIDSFY